MKRLLFCIYITAPAWISLLTGFLFAFNYSDTFTLAALSETLALVILYTSKKAGFELYRKFIHISGMIILISVIYLGFERNLLLFVIGAITILSIPVYFYPNSFPDIIRDLAIKSIRGGRSIRCITHFLAASFIMIMFLPYNAIMLGLIITLIGDPAAFLAGSRYGKKKIINEKTIEGSIAFFFSVFVVLLLLGQGLFTTLIASATGAIVEHISGKYIDDNATIPIATALIMAI